MPTASFVFGLLNEGREHFFQGLLLKYPNVILEDSHRVPNKPLSGTILAKISFPIMVLKSLIR